MTSSRGQHIHLPAPRSWSLEGSWALSACVHTHIQTCANTLTGDSHTVQKSTPLLERENSWNTAVLSCNEIRFLRSLVSVWALFPPFLLCHWGGYAWEEEAVRPPYQHSRPCPCKAGLTDSISSETLPAYKGSQERPCRRLKGLPPCVFQISLPAGIHWDQEPLPFLTE